MYSPTDISLSVVVVDGVGVRVCVRRTEEEELSERLSLCNGRGKLRITEVSWEWIKPYLR